MQLSALYRYPLKSAAGESMGSALSDALGLAGDRRWMLAEADSGRFVSQRNFPRLGLLQARLVANGLTVVAPGLDRLTVAQPDADSPARRVQIWGEQADALDAGNEAAARLGSWLGLRCRLVYLPLQQGVPVDTRYAAHGERTGFSDGFPFLLIGQASLEDLSERVGRELDMRRFRPNLVVQGAPAYAEDQWRRIRIGPVTFRVVKPCTRCIITTLDPDSGSRDSGGEPLATLARYRKGEGGVLFGQNLIAENTGELKLGMSVEVLE
ncbi:MOSC domain-containing protein [Stutzerimonas tarimensis]|uniref:MOSC domain-containing protein n=1 Tax=Stutzerimonas tarimensis TaxID=1507735 RepID=A0ABV7T2K9_9GAMM